MLCWIFVIICFVCPYGSTKTQRFFSFWH